MELVAVVAMTEDRVIATENDVPWNYPADVKQYKDRVSESPVILGRQTYESMLPDPPGRRHIVLSRSLETAGPATATIARSPAEALTMAAEMDAETVYVLGGGEIYDAFLPEYDRMVISVVDYLIDHESCRRIVRFPEWDDTAWEKVSIDNSYNGFRIDFWESTDSN
ncbi:MAG: dihydrofolate reductase [Halobellus sp.]|uniref:dihydrofolate reductase n=1 Tax=Halobellus sp. TaxID=1979212 RepID=UPI0035D4DCD2